MPERRKRSVSRIAVTRHRAMAGARYRSFDCGRTITSADPSFDPPIASTSVATTEAVLPKELPLAHLVALGDRSEHRAGIAEACENAW